MLDRWTSHGSSYFYRKPPMRFPLFVNRLMFHPIPSQSKLAAQNGDKEEQQIQALSGEAKAAESRYVELDRIMEQLYEDKVSGSLSDTRFRKLADKYENEQAALEKRIEELKYEVEHLTANRRDASTWLELIKNYADIQELDRIVLGELIEKITVGEAQVIDGVKHIEITIYYRFVGAVRL